MSKYSWPFALFLVASVGCNVSHINGIDENDTIVGETPSVVAYDPDTNTLWLHY